MIVLSLLLVIAAAVCLFIGLFLSEALTFIYVAIVLCLLSLLLLWLGSRAHRRVAPSEPSEPVYGGATRPGATAAARPATGTAFTADEEEDDLDALTAPSGSVVTKTSARERAAARAEPGPSSSPTTAQTPATTKAAKRTTTKKAATRKTAKKAATKKAATKKASTRKAATKKSAKKTSSSGRRTTGAAARSRLGAISGIGPSKQDALLERYGSIESIRDASVDDIVDNVKGFGPALAQRVKDEL